MRAKRGFTLIEILVVVIIMGITVGFALLAFGDFGASRRATLAAEQFSSFIKLAQEQAIIEGSTLGIDINNSGYSSYRFVQGRWQQISGSNVFRSHNFPDNVTANLRLGIRKSNSKDPSIIISASGDVSSFVIDFGTNRNSVVTSLSNRDGQLKLQQPKN
ncbi:Putative general secretion pathway protein H [Legionella massiliensis]|uniref:Type II secretion system protein H n=1 Tax=Legionella massiliensis TaxID=1034943 RepID=A0A078L2Q3_9GAMM|nr:type II secretion system minor pseudopilin GspH [Legionella massiliensis]CDZ78399.1 Putative general secretion pathway protein H [Legionella massiliensis]CEE14137.1 Putative type II secretion system protein H precursor [Legionella massiliensis]